MAIELGQTDGFGVSVDLPLSMTGPALLDFGFEVPIEESDAPDQLPETLCCPAQIPELEDPSAQLPMTMYDATDSFKSRASYTISRMQRWPTMFAQRSITPFIHSSSLSGYGRENGADEDGSPKSSNDVMLDALSACGLYHSITEENRGAVLEHIRRKSRLLIEAREPINERVPEQILSALQALLLYQIIRLFDGDVRSRSEAEADEAVTTRWTTELLRFLKPLGSDDTSPEGLSNVQDEPELIGAGNWQTWVFEESVRRTMIVSIMIRLVYLCVKDRIVTQCIPEAHLVSFTGRRALWEAPSEFHWRSICAEGISYAANPSQWEFLTATMDVREVDELVVLLLAIVHGLDHVANWLGKENLPTYGLDANSIRKFLI